MVFPEMVLVATPATPEQSAANPDVQAVQKYLAATDNGDETALRMILTDAFVLRVPGRSPVSGAYRGVEGMTQWCRAVQERSGGTFKIARVMIALAMEGHVHLIAIQSASREGKTLNAAHTMTFEIEDGRITESQIYEEDQYAVDAFWA